MPVHGGRLEDCLYHCYRTESGTNSRVQESIRTHEKRWHLRTSTVSHGKGIRSASTPSARGIEPNQEDKSAGSPPSLSKKRGNSIRLCLVFISDALWSSPTGQESTRELTSGRRVRVPVVFLASPGSLGRGRERHAPSSSSQSPCPAAPQETLPRGWLYVSFVRSSSRAHQESLSGAPSPFPISRSHQE